MRIKNLPSIESMDGSQDALVIEQTDGSEDKSRKVSPAQIKQYVLGDMDEVPTQNSNNPVKSGGIFSTMAVPKYDSANRREYYEGGAAFDGNIDSTPTAGSNNAVASGGTKTYVDNAISSAVKIAYITGTTSANGNMQLMGLSKANTIVLGCQFSNTSNVSVVAIPYTYSGLAEGNWGVHCIMETASYNIVANTALKGYVYYIEKRAYTD